MKMDSDENLTDADCSSASNDSRYRQFIGKLAIIVMFAAVLLVLWQGAEVLLLIFAGFLVAVFLRSLSGILSRYSPLSDNWALTVVLFAVVGAVALGGWLLAPSVENQFNRLSDELPAVYEQARQQLAQYPLGRRLVEQVPPPSQLVFGRQAGNIFGRVTGIFSSVFNAAANFLIVLMTAIYFAFSLHLYLEGIIKLIPKKGEKRAREILSAIYGTLQNFLLGISGSMTINGTLTFLGLWFLGIPFAIPLGIITGLMSFIPNIGPLIAGVPAVLIALAQSPPQALYVIFLYLVVQNLDGFLFSPLIQQRAVSIPPIILIAAQLLLAVIFGFLGLLLAVPMVAVVFVAVKMIYVEDILGKTVVIKGETKVTD